MDGGSVELGRVNDGSPRARRCVVIAGEAPEHRMAAALEFVDQQRQGSAGRRPPNVLLVGDPEATGAVVRAASPHLAQSVTRWALDSLQVASGDSRQWSALAAHRVDDPDRAQVKGDVRMRVLLRTALWMTCAPTLLEVVVDGHVDFVPRSVVEDEVEALFARGARYGNASFQLRSRFVGSCTVVAGQADSIFPRVDPIGFVRRFLSEPELGRRANDVFDDAEMAALYRRPAGHMAGARAWSCDDLALIDWVAYELASTVQHFDHVIVDSPETLSDMQLEMIARRSGSSLVLGAPAESSDATFERLETTTARLIGTTTIEVLDAHAVFERRASHGPQSLGVNGDLQRLSWQDAVHSLLVAPGGHTITVIAEDELDSWVIEAAIHTIAETGSAIVAVEPHRGELYRRLFVALGYGPSDVAIIDDAAAVDRGLVLAPSPDGTHAQLSVVPTGEVLFGGQFCVRGFFESDECRRAIDLTEDPTMGSVRDQPAERSW